jgi:hypothetical protein
MTSAGPVAAVTQPRRRSHINFHFRAHVYGIFDLFSIFYVHGILRVIWDSRAALGAIFTRESKASSLDLSPDHLRLLALGFLEAQVYQQRVQFGPPWGEMEDRIQHVCNRQHLARGGPCAIHSNWYVTKMRPELALGRFDYLTSAHFGWGSSRA